MGYLLRNTIQLFDLHQCTNRQTSNEEIRVIVSTKGLAKVEVKMGKTKTVLLS